MKSWLRLHAARWSRIAVVAVILVALPAMPARAQFFGAGYGYPAYGYGYGWPGYGGTYGYGYPGLAYGYGFGYGGYPAFGGGYYAGGVGTSIVAPYAPFGIYYGGPGPGVYNPLFGVGLSPLGVDSALTERYMLGRRLTQYQRGYGTAPPAGTMPGTTTAPAGK
jgi:hypothetical protein